MAILKIAKLGHPNLKERSERVRDPLTPEISALIASMLDTMFDAEGLGLAAPQVHVPKRVIIFQIPQIEEGNEGVKKHAMESDAPTILINPEIEIIDDATETGWEGCLSVPGLRGQVPRYRRISYSGLTPTGEHIMREAEGMHARVVQHECDHLDGILYPMRMEDLSSLVFLSEWPAYMASNEALAKLNEPDGQLS